MELSEMQSQAFCLSLGIKWEEAFGAGVAAQPGECLPRLWSPSGSPSTPWIEYRVASLYPSTLKWRQKEQEPRISLAT